MKADEIKIDDIVVTLTGERYRVSDIYDNVITAFHCRYGQCDPIHISKVLRVEN